VTKQVYSVERLGK